MIEPHIQRDFFFHFFTIFTASHRTHLGRSLGAKDGGGKSAAQLCGDAFQPLGHSFFPQTRYDARFFCQSQTTRESIKEGMYFKGDYHFLFNDQHNINFLFHFLYFNTLIFNINEEDCCCTLEPLHDFSWYQPHFESF